MTLTVVGSIAFDAVETPSGSRDRLLGGSAVHFAHRLVAVRRDPHRRAGGRRLRRARSTRSCTTRGVLTDDVEHVPGGKTFFWAGRYHRDINQRDTLQTDLNVFEDFQPKLSAASRDAEVLFLGNIQPDLQREVREQCRGARFVAMDSMNLWIDIAHDALRADDRARRLPRAQRLRAQAAHRRAEPRPRRAQGARARPARGDRQAGRVRLGDDHARRLLRADGVPDGRDRRADGRRRHVRRRPDGLPRRRRAARSTTRRCAARWPTAPRCASFNVEGFGSERLYELERAEIDARVAELEAISRF